MKNRMNNTQSVGELANVFLNSVTNTQNKQTMKKKKAIDPENKPLRYSLDPKALPGETFRVLTVKGETFYVSNLGRVRRGFHKWKNYNNAIIPSSRLKGGKFYVRLVVGYTVRCVDLVYNVFIGEIPEGKLVGVKDGDNRNITPKNLILIPKSRKGMPRITGNPAPKRVLKTKLVSRDSIMASSPKELTIDLNKGNKAAKVAELNAKLRYYYADKADNGVYLLKLKNK